MVQASPGARGDEALLGAPGGSGPWLFPASISGLGI